MQLKKQQVQNLAATRFARTDSTGRLLAGIPVDPAAISTRRPWLLWPDQGGNNRSPVDYSYLFFPAACLAQALLLTSAALQVAGRSALTEQEPCSRSASSSSASSRVPDSIRSNTPRTTSTPTVEITSR